MKITPSSITDIANGNGVEPATSATGGSAPARVQNTPVEPVNSSASIEISAASRALSASAADTGIDTKRVSDIQQAISDGRFQINAGVVADKLIASVHELLARN